MQFNSVPCPTFQCMIVPSKCEENKVITIESSDLQFLSQTFELISQYTRKVDPAIPLKTPNFKQVSATTYSVEIQDILPRMVRVFFGAHSLAGNCHGSALVTSGIFPVLSYLPRGLPITTNWVREKLEDVDLKNITSGDLVNLSCQGDSHSFVFLSHDLCLSMNGKGKTLDLCRTSDVLELYGFPANALTTPSSHSSAISIFRKKGNETYFEGIMPTLIEYFGAYTSLFSSPSISCHPIFPRLAGIKKEIKTFGLSAQKKPELSESSKAAVRFMSQLCKGSFPILPKSDETKPKLLKTKKIKDLKKSNELSYSCVVTMKLVSLILGVTFLLMGTSRLVPGM